MSYPHFPQLFQQLYFPVFPTLSSIISIYLHSLYHDFNIFETPPLSSHKDKVLLFSANVLFLIPLFATQKFFLSKKESSAPLHPCYLSCKYSSFIHQLACCSFFSNKKKPSEVSPWLLLIHQLYQSVISRVA